MKALTFALVALALSACNGCKGGVVIIQPPPAVQWDGGTDDSARACAVLAAAGCPEGDDPDCAMAFRNDQAQGVGSQVNEACILDAGPNRSALQACRACMP